MPVSHLLPDKQPKRTHLRGLGLSPTITPILALEKSLRPAPTR